MNPVRLLHHWNRLVTRRMIACGLILCASGFTVEAQSGRLSPYQGESDGVSAGGKWMEFRSEDKMTAAKKVRFELVADNYFREDPDSKPRVDLFCSDGKLTLADFNPGERLGHPDYPGFWGQPKMEVQVRIDGSHRHHGWNWVNGHFLSMDKGTTRQLIGAHLFRIEFQTPRGSEIAEFSPDGLDLRRMKQACDLKPKH